MATGFICIWNQYPRTEDPKRKWIFTSLKFIGVIILFYLAVTFRNPKGEVFGANWGILGSIGWAYLLCAMIYVFTRDRLKYLIPVWGAFMIICMLGSRMNEAWGGTAILSLPRPNFYNDFLGILHIGNGAVPAFTLGGVIFSLICARYAQVPWKKKALYVIAAVSILLIAGVICRQFWILAKLGATPTWVFIVTAITVGTYSILSWLAEKGKAAWFNVIKPAGTATLTCYLIPYVSYALADLTGIILPDWFTYGFMGIVNCLCFALAIIGVTYLLGRIHIKLKV